MPTDNKRPGKKFPTSAIPRGATASAPVRKAAKAGTPASIAAPKIVTVQGGDNLTKIAKANDTTVAAVLRLNPRLAKNPDLIYRGTKVRVRK